jgi:hypothetical protein
MTLELELDSIVAAPKPGAKYGSLHVRHKEDVPHEHAIPDFYGLRENVLRGVTEAIKLREATRKLIDRCHVMQCTEDDDVWGALVIWTTARSKGSPRDEVAYVDVIVSDQVSQEGHDRLRRLKADLTAASMVVVETDEFARPHAHIPGSKQFHTFRYAKAVSA